MNNVLFFCFRTCKIILYFDKICFMINVFLCDLSSCVLLFFVFLLLVFASCFVCSLHRFFVFVSFVCFLFASLGMCVLI